MARQVFEYENRLSGRNVDGSLSGNQGSIPKQGNLGDGGIDFDFVGQACEREEENRKKGEGGTKFHSVKRSVGGWTLVSLDRSEMAILISVPRETARNPNFLETAESKDEMQLFDVGLPLATAAETLCVNLTQ